MTRTNADYLGAAVTVKSALIAWFAEALPVLQGCAAIVAIVVGLLTIWRWFKPK